jgi:hypothetical protein
MARPAATIGELSALSDGFVVMLRDGKETSRLGSGLIRRSHACNCRSAFVRLGHYGHGHRRVRCSVSPHSMQGHTRDIAQQRLPYVDICSCLAVQPIDRQPASGFLILAIFWDFRPAFFALLYR